MTAITCLWMHCSNKTLDPSGFCHFHKSNGVAHLRYGGLHATSFHTKIEMLPVKTITRHGEILENTDFSADRIEDDGLPISKLKRRAYEIVMKRDGLTLEDLSEIVHSQEAENLFRDRVLGHKYSFDARRPEFAMWQTLGFDLDEALKWRMKGSVKSPYHATILRDMGLDPEDPLMGRGSSAKSAYVHSATTVDSDELPELLDYVERLHTTTKCTPADALIWYRDNWSVESAERHLLAGRSIKDANILHHQDKLRDFYGEFAETAIKDVGDISLYTQTRVLRDGFRAAEELVHAGLKPADAHEWIRQDFCSMGRMSDYVRRGYTLEQAHRAETREYVQGYINSRIEQETSPDKRRMSPEKEQEFISAAEEWMYGSTDLTARRSKENDLVLNGIYKVHRDLIIMNNAGGTLSIPNSIAWARFVAENRGTVTASDPKYDLIYRSERNDYMYYDFTPEDALIIRQAGEMSKGEIRELRKEVDAGTPLEWAIAWRSDGTS